MQLGHGWIGGESWGWEGATDEPLPAGAPGTCLQSKWLRAQRWWLQLLSFAALYCGAGVMAGECPWRTCACNRLWGLHLVLWGLAGSRCLWCLVCQVPLPDPVSHPAPSCAAVIGKWA